MREVGAPEYTEEELEFARKIGETIPKYAKVEGLKTYNVPNWEKYVNVDLVTEILDPWDEGKVMPGSTDVSDVSWITPTTEFYTTGSVLGSPGHSWRTVSTSGMSIGHKSLIFAAKTIAGTALDLITNETHLENAKKEHKEKLAGRKYESPLLPDAKPPIHQWT
jgi:aminobenzoyl-glutamate utilization protein B